VRVDTDLPPEGLRHHRQAAEHAAHSGDLRSRHPAGLAAHAYTRRPPGTSSGCGTRATETARNPSLRQPQRPFSTGRGTPSPPSPLHNAPSRPPSIPQLPPSRPFAPFSPHLKWVLCSVLPVGFRCYYWCVPDPQAPLVFQKQLHSQQKNEITQRSQPSQGPEEMRSSSSSC
jgi:hypothetical protein